MKEDNLPLKPSSILILMSVGMIFSNFLGIIISYILFREWGDRSYYLNENAKNLINFNLSFTIYHILAGITMILLIGIIALPIVLILYFVLSIKGIIKYANEENYNYPLTIRFIK